VAVRQYWAPDGRLVGLFVPADFDAFEETGLVRRVRLTDPTLPLQVVLVERPAGSRVPAHYHPAGERAEPSTRHQVLLCVRGRARVGLYTREGLHVDTVELGPGDLVLATEGHSVEVVESGTRILEVQTGPVDDSGAWDRVELEARDA